MAASFSVRRSATGAVTPGTLGLIDFGASGAAHWLSATAVSRGQEDGLSFAANSNVLFGDLHVSESELADAETATHRAYARIDAFLAAHGYPHLLRCWNFVHDLHRGAGDTERYKQFVAGRYRAWSSRAGFEQRLPAATVIGSAEPGLRIYFLAARTAGTAIENPRQTPAWKYPREYGPRSPSFARAMRKDWDGESHLYVSGTASVVGHQTHHAADAAAQLRETHTNIGALLAEAGGGWRPLLLKLYVRREADLRIAQKLALELWGADAPFLWLRGDICRSDLLLEVEGVFVR